MFNEILEIFHDKKKLSLFKLIIYAIFFIFVFIIISQNDTNFQNNTEQIDNSETSMNYEYIYRINEDNLINEITGIKTNSSNEFTYNNNKYKIIENTIYDDNNIKVDDLPINIVFFEYDKIEDLIKISEFVEKTIYSNNSEKIIYNISAIEYFNYINDTYSCTIKDCNSILLNYIIQKDEYITNVKFNLYDYYGYTYYIEITYNKLN